MSKTMYTMEVFNANPEPTKLDKLLELIDSVEDGVIIFKNGTKLIYDME